MPAVTFIETGGDGTRGLEFWGASTGTVTVDTGVSNTGPASIKFDSTAGNLTANLKKGGVCQDSGTRINFWIKFDAFAINAARIIYIGNNSTFSSDCWSLACVSGVLKLFRNTDGAQVGTNGSTLSTGVWYRICISYVITSASVNDCKVYVGRSTDVPAYSGTIESNLTAHNVTTTTGADGIFVGICNGTPGANVVYHMDDFYVDVGSDLSDVGAVHCTWKRPVSNGTTNGFTGTGTPSGYGSGNAGYVNEQPLNTSNFVSVVGAGAAVTEEYNIESKATGDVDLTPNTVVDYMGAVYAKSLTGETAQIVVGGVASNISITSSNTMFSKPAGSATYPAGGTDIGIITDTSLTTVTLYEAGVAFAYTLGGGGGVTVFVMNAGTRQRPYQMASTTGGDPIMRGQA